MGDQIYQFNGLDDNPLRYIMKLDDNNYLIRDVNCDLAVEHWRIITKYVAIEEDKEVNKGYEKTVYRGRDIDDLNFLDKLLRSVLFGIVIHEK